ncbi:hypothetical protein BJ165DRAFT_1531937 [Panaeolus papilionaceus]|nr:hypothetical protein BJ165DRAFT_1531937 [Panaeolus papilionaceus]
MAEWSITNYPSVVIEEAVDILREEEDYETLKSLCLTASVFQDVTQKAIFYKASITNPADLSGLSRLRSIDQQTKRIEAMYTSVMAREELARYVKVLELDTHNASITTPPIMNYAAYLLLKFTRVEKFTLSSGTELKKVQGTVLESAIFAVLASPSLTTVEFSSFVLLVPMHLLKLGPSVTNLSFTDGTTFQPFTILELLGKICAPSGPQGVDILEHYPGRHSKSEAIKKKVYIETLEIGGTYSVLLLILNSMLQSDYCHLDLSRIITFRVTTGGLVEDPFPKGQPFNTPHSWADFMQVLKNFCDLLRHNLRSLHLTDGQRGFFFPEDLTLKDFPKLEVLAVSLNEDKTGLETTSTKKLFDFLGRGNIMSKLEVLFLTVENQPQKRPVDIRREHVFWKELETILSSPAFVKFQGLCISVILRYHWLPNQPSGGATKRTYQDQVELSSLWTDAYTAPLMRLHKRFALKVIYHYLPAFG